MSQNLLTVIQNPPKALSWSRVIKANLAHDRAIRMKIMLSGFMEGRSINPEKSVQEMLARIAEIDYPDPAERYAFLRALL